MNKTAKRAALAKMNAEFKRASDFDLLDQEAVLEGSMTLSRCLARNIEWLIDHTHDVERTVRAVCRKELEQEFDES